MMRAKWRAFIDSYFTHHMNATDAYCEVYGCDKFKGAASGSRLLRNVNVAEAIKQRLDENTMGADEILHELADIGREKIGDFYKVFEEWTFYPLPTYEILGAKEVVDDTDPDKPVTRTSYWVRHVTIDLDKLMDPKYSGLVQEFTDSPRDGLGIKLHGKVPALQFLAKLRGMVVDKTDVTSGGEPLKVLVEYVNNQASTASTPPSAAPDQEQPKAL